MKDITFRITALWAFSECALGGLMHAFKLPFTGLFVGGFAVLCVGLLAYAERPAASTIMRATALVMLVKAVVSPHSPPQAYVAVGFQGALGALLLGYLRPSSLTTILYGFVAIAESALQKLLMLYVFFGKSLFEAADLFVADVLKKFGLQSDVSWAWSIAWAYVGLYALWGAVLGYWIPRLPGLLLQRSQQYLSAVEAAPQVEMGGKKPSFPKKIAFLVAVLLFIVGTFLLTGTENGGGMQKAIYAVVRTLAVLAAWLFVVRPLIQGLIQRWAQRKAKEESSILQQLIAAMPDWRTRATRIFAAVSQQHRGWRRWSEFALALLAVALYEEPISVHDQ